MRLGVICFCGLIILWLIDLSWSLNEQHNKKSCIWIIFRKRRPLPPRRPQNATTQSPTDEMTMSAAVTEPMPVTQPPEIPPATSEAPPEMEAPTEGTQAPPEETTEATEEVPEVTTQEQTEAGTEAPEATTQEPGTTEEGTEAGTEGGGDATTEEAPPQETDSPEELTEPTVTEEVVQEELSRLRRRNGRVFG
ncbi:uncharacterized protein LOC126265903 [Aethina tumida]|uniref:uncharacterized protein LOC126265903 n=1 Tax=Aethina tumida TaxID=116153 RepID=UPI002148FFBA|nr:uncharacterized protein LOC126265903 [Aethina tumida]